MIRRLFRFVVAAFCLLSLLAAAGTACLWWESRGGQGYVADASVLGTYVVVELLPGGRTGIMVVRRWPGRATVRFWSQHAYYDEHPIYWHGHRGCSRGTASASSGQSGQLAVFVRRDTREPIRWDPGRMPPKSVVVAHGPMPAWTAGGIPVWLVIAGMLVPPLLLEGRRWRRVREHRRRVRLGLCLACGYDLRHSPEKCPECGSASVQARTNPPAADVPTTTPAG